VSPTLTTFLFEAANFLVLAAVLGWLFFKPVRQALADRRARLASEEQQAADKLADADRAQQQIDADRSQLQEELNELRAREVETARKQADQLLADARTAAARELEASHRRAVRLSETQQDRLAQAAALAAADTVAQLLEQIGGPEIHTALLRSACQHVRALSPEALAPVKVETATPLSSKDRAILDEALGPAAAGADYRTSKELGVGVRIATGQGLIDASASGLSGFARQALLKHINHRANHHNPLQQANDD
jgi:F0F1-type ATP synthase membrane subunit b/b'